MNPAVIYLPYLIQVLYYVCCISFGFCIVLGTWYGFRRRDWDTASILFAVAILSIFALLPYLRSGSVVVQAVGT